MKKRRRHQADLWYNKNKLGYFDMTSILHFQEKSGRFWKTTSNCYIFLYKNIELPESFYPEKKAYFFRWMYIRRYVKRGGLARAYKFFENVLITLKSKVKQDLLVLDVFFKSVCFFLPEIDLKKVKLGGHLYSIPKDISFKKQVLLSSTWFLNEIRKRCAGKLTKKGYINLLLECFTDFEKESQESLMLEYKESWENEGLFNRALLTYIK